MGTTVNTAASRHLLDSALPVASANFFNFRGALLLSVHVAPAGRSIAARRTERAHRTWGRRPARTTTWSRYAPPRVSSASPRGFRCLFAHRHPRDLTSPPTRRHEQAHKPTSVTHSVVGNFTHDDELNLIVAYVPAASRTHPPPTLPRRLHRLVRKAQRSVRSSFLGDFLRARTCATTRPLARLTLLSFAPKQHTGNAHAWRFTCSRPRVCAPWWTRPSTGASRLSRSSSLR